MPRSAITFQLFDQLAFAFAAVLGSCAPASPSKLRTANSLQPAAQESVLSGESATSPSSRRDEKRGSSTGGPALAECKTEYSKPNLTILYCGAIALRVM